MARTSRRLSYRTREIWSGRYEKADGCGINRWSKRITHKYERRSAKAEVRKSCD